MAPYDLLPDQPSYPPGLRDLARESGEKPRPAPSLRLRGALSSKPGIAVVGTRDASPEALAFTRQVAVALVDAGFAVWSGGALGIDGAAHTAAVERGGDTVVVFAGGLARPYPHEHLPLFERVLAAGGALLSGVTDGEPPTPPRFIRRNELLAAATRATLVVEAGLESGARSTAAAARRLGRVVLAVPHCPWSERGRGAAAELVRGATPVVSPRQLVHTLTRLWPEATRAAPRRAPSAPPAAPPEGLDPTEQTVLNALEKGPVHIETVCEITGLSFPEVSGALLTLTLHAVVVEAPAGFYGRAHR